MWGVPHCTTSYCTSTNCPGCLTVSRSEYRRNILADYERNSAADIFYKAKEKKKGQKIAFSLTFTWRSKSPSTSLLVKFQLTQMPCDVRGCGKQPS